MFDNICQQDYTIKWSNLTIKQNPLELSQKGTYYDVQKEKKNQNGKKDNKM